MRSTKYTWARRGLALGIAIASISGARVSRADGPAPTTPAPATSSAQADDATMAEARKHFQAGVNLLDDPDGARYEEAYHAFHKAYDLSKSPKVLGNIGFCSFKLERDGEAIDAYSAYLRDSKDIDERERVQIERDLATLTSTVALFKATVKKPAGSWVLVDTREQTRGTPVVNSYSFQGGDITLRVRPGRHVFKVKGADGESIPYEVTLEPASQKTHEFTWAPPVVTAPVGSEAPRSRPSYAGPIVLGAIGLAALGAGGVTGLMARSKTNDIENRCPNNACPATYDFQSDRSSAKTLGTVADVSFIGGGVALAGAIVWALVLPSGSSSKSPKTGSAAWLPGAQCSARGCGVQLEGAF